jgi:hypothetical protein
VSDDDLAEVIELPRGREFNRNQVEGELDELPVRTAPFVSRACSHRGAYINLADRRVYCRACEQELDPYKVLDEIARNREHMVTTAQRLRFETDSLLKRVNELERLERNAKSRIRTAKKWLRKHAGATWADLYSDDDLFRSDLELSGLPEEAHGRAYGDEIAF